MAKRKAVQKRKAAPPAPESPITAAAKAFSWKWLIGWIGGIGVLLTAIIALKNAHPIIEPLAPAVRGYVREYSDDVTKQRLEPISKWMADYDAFRATQLFEAAKLSLIQLNQNLILAKKELDTNPQSRFLQDAVEQLQSQILDTRKRVEIYEALVKKGHMRDK